MGILKDKIEKDILSNNNSKTDNFKNNSLLLFNKYNKSDDDVKMIPVGKIQLGGFYFLHYNDDSNWMRWAPIFTVNFKKFSNIIIIFGVNFNFIPLEIRVDFFDRYITEQDFDNDSLLAVNYETVYNELRRIGFEYAITEFNASNILKVHKISMNILPKFLYSQHPNNKYDPEALMKIWKVKLQTKEKRHQEMTNSIIKDFYDIKKDISNKYEVLDNHIKRLRKNLQNKK